MFLMIHVRVCTPGLTVKTSFYLR